MGSVPGGIQGSSSRFQYVWCWQYEPSKAECPVAAALVSSQDKFCAVRSRALSGSVASQQVLWLCWRHVNHTSHLLIKSFLHKSAASWLMCLATRNSDRYTCFLLFDVTSKTSSFEVVPFHTAPWFPPHGDRRPLPSSEVHVSSIQLNSRCGWFTSRTTFVSSPLILFSKTSTFSLVTHYTFLHFNGLF